MNTKEQLKRVFEQMPQRLAEVDRFIQGVTTHAYRSLRLIANETLGRNPHTSDFLRKALFDVAPQYPGVLAVGWRLLRFYAINLAVFLLWTANYATWRWLIAKGRTGLRETSRDLYLLDVFVFAHNVLPEGKYREQCFPGLTEVLEKKGNAVVIFPKFFGRLTPSRLLKLERILAASGYQFVTEFDLMRWRDVLRYFGLLVLYPFDVIRLALHCAGEKTSAMTQLLGAELLAGLDANVGQVFVRYLSGKRLSTVVGEAAGSQKIYLVNWFENQVIDKALFRGVREGRAPITIFGVQSFIAYPAYLCERVAVSDSLFGMTPDIVLVNSAAYATQPVAQRVGVSFRSGDLFHQRIQWEKKTHAAIFLPYHRAYCEDVIALCSTSTTLLGQSLLVTTHPGSRMAHMPGLPQGWNYSSRSRFDLLATTAIVISTESSTLIEAAALGTSVIVVAGQSSFTCNPMLAEGRGELWEIAFDGDEVESAYHRLIDYRRTHPQRIRELAEFYKSQCFVEPTEEAIVAAFELEKTG